MKGQTVHLPKRAWRLGLFFIGILLAGDILMQLDSTDVDLDIAKTQAQIAQLDAQIQSMEGTIAIGFV